MGIQKVFISCVSGEFKSFRLALAAHLGAVKDPDKLVETRVQEDFQQSGHTLLDQLIDYIERCDRIIHLVGAHAGESPSDSHKRILATRYPETLNVLPNYSYTQWEYHLAKQAGKPVLVYLFDSAKGILTSPSCEVSESQVQHVRSILSSGQTYREVRDLAGFVKEVFYDLGLNPENSKPRKVYPPPLGRLLKGRDGALEQIRKHLVEMHFEGHSRASAIVNSPRPLVLTGPKGVGKTQLAVEYGHRLAASYTAILLVRAETVDDFKYNIGDLCQADAINIPLADAGSEQRLNHVKAWLDQHPGWLLIIDNVDVVGVQAAVYNWVSNLQPAGHVIITSILQNWASSFVTMDVDVLCPEDGAEYLLESTYNRVRSQADSELALTISKDLGGLALALQLASAFIQEKRTSFFDYRELWKSNLSSMADWHNSQLVTYPRSLGASIQLAMAQLSPNAIDLLNILSWFSGEPLPRSVFESRIPELPDLLPKEAFSFYESPETPKRPHV